MNQLLEVTGVSKRFPGVLALDKVDFDLRENEVHALLGENGAGKSTLVKIITGAYQKDAGVIKLRGSAVDFNTPADAQNAGINGVYQEFSQVNTLTIAENIFLGSYPKKGFFIDWKTMNEEAAKLLTQFAVDASPRDVLSTLGVATRQMVEILKVIRKDKLKILVLDEPTSALSDNETQTLFSFIKSLKSHGVSVIYISHRLEEIKQICDRITVFKNGSKVATSDARKMTVDSVVAQMVGRELKDHFPKKHLQRHETRLEVEAISGDGFSNITFKSYPGEILGFTGQVGAGKSELLEAIFGARPLHFGSIVLDGVTVNIKSPIDAVKRGIGLLPESRKEQGLNLSMNCLMNISLASLEFIATPLLDLEKEKKIASEKFEALEIRPNNPRNLAANLSGGNQQKIVLAKWIMRDSSVLLFDEPTRGIDVGAKFQIYTLIAELAKAGKTIIVASSEIEEIVGICSRVIVLRKGTFAEELHGDRISYQNIVHSMGGEKIVS